MKTIVWGYWEKNLGDDLLLKSYVNFSNKYFGSNSRIYICCRRKYKRYYRQMGLHTFDSDCLLYKVLNRLLRIEPFVICSRNKKFLILGGSLFAENKNKTIEEKQMKTLNWAINKCKSSYILGSNFGPFKNKIFLETYRNLFQKVDAISFRDKKSIAYFSGLHNIVYHPDFVLSGLWDDLIAKNQFNDSEKDTVIFSLINFDLRKNLKQFADKYTKLIIELINLHIAQKDKIILFSFCDKEGDYDYCCKVKDLINNEDVSVIKYENFDVLSSFKKTKKIYGTRFHANILAIYYGIDFLPIVYDEKIENALNCYCERQIESIKLDELEKIKAKDVFFVSNKIQNQFLISESKKHTEIFT